MLKYYIDMERLRFSDKFECTIQRDNDVDENLLIPSMVIQPHAENAIWHGLMHLETDAMLTIHFSKITNAKAIKVVIKDNGVGRAKAAELRSKQVLKNKSYGSSISEDRIRNVNSHNGITDSIEIIDLIDDQGKPCGTQVTLTLYANGLNDNPQKS